MVVASTRIGNAVESIPTPRPAMMFVAEPVTERSTMPMTGLVPVPV